jgi:hypothetical protein
LPPVATASGPEPDPVRNSPPCVNRLMWKLAQDTSQELEDGLGLLRVMPLVVVPE